MTIAVTLLVVGLVLLFFEVLLPGMILGALALLTLGGSVAAAYINTDYGHIFLAINLTCICAFAIWFVVYFPNSKFGKKLSTDSTVGDLGIDHSLLINKTGTTFTDLRPSGKATIEDQRLHVVTEGTFIEKDNPIRVISTEGNRIVVRKI